VFDTAVIGGGVAGLTAGLFSARCGRSTIVLVSHIPGGHLTNIEHVEDFPGFLQGVAGYELGPTIQEQAANAGATFQMAEVLSLEPIARGWTLTTSDGTIEARAVIVAAGSRPRTLGVPGEGRLRGRGVSNCASCDGPLLRGGTATVVGGGDSALQEALTLAGFASEVLIVHRSGACTAQAVYEQRVQSNPRISLRANTIVEEVLGESTVAGLRLRDLVTGEVEAIDTGAVFVYVGLEPNTAFLAGRLPLDDAGRIPTDVCMRTGVAGIFAAGDIRSDSASQAVTAAGDGATAALTAHRYLQILP
jgi:thioredoxin reductase (NADPH)